MKHIAFVNSNMPGIETIRLAQEAGHFVSFLRAQPTTYGNAPETLAVIQSCDLVLDVDSTTDVVGVAGALRRCHERRPLDAVITQDEFAMEATAAACSALGIPFTDAAAVKRARQKHLCRECLDEAKLPSARYGHAESVEGALAAARRIGYPVVAKPASGTDSLFAAVAHDEASLRMAAARVLDAAANVPAAWREQFSRGVLVEEMLTGTFVSVELAMLGAEHRVLCVSGRFRWRDDETIELGSFIPSNLPSDEARACADYALQVCRKLGLTFGIFHLEIMSTARGPVLVEANPRLMGGGLPFIYQAATGHNVHQSLLQLFVDRSIESIPQSVPSVGAGRKIMPTRGGRLAAMLELDWLRAAPDTPIVRFDNYGIRPGRDVARGEVIGRLILRARTYDAVLDIAVRTLRRLEKDLGLPLMIELAPDLESQSRSQAASL